MYSLNRATILGNLTRDPETRQTTGGQTVCSFGVATSRQWKDASGQKQEQTEFHNIVAWGKLGEICGQYMRKGVKAYVEGRIQTRDWEGQDGVKKYRTEIVADNVIILDRVSGGAAPAAGGNAFAANTGFGKPSSAPMSEPSASPDDEIKVEDIPF